MRSASDQATFDLWDLAQLLTPWRELVDHPVIFKLWSSAAPCKLTYWWLSSLREVLQPYQLLAIANRYLLDCGFIPNQSKLIIQPYCGHQGPHFLQELEDAKHSFSKRWAIL